MVKFFSKEYTIPHPWRTTSSAFWRKYPNPSAPHVLAVDAFDRKICPTTGKLTVNRLICVQSAAPAWIPGPRMQYAVEETTVDPSEQSMVIKSRNVTGASLLLVEETCTYAAASPTSTRYTQSAQIRSWVPLISAKLEHYTYDSMLKKSQKGVETVEALCQRAHVEGVSCLSSLHANFSSFATSAVATAASRVCATAAVATSTTGTSSQS